VAGDLMSFAKEGYEIALFFMPLFVREMNMNERVE
jgi:hypothetical protein